jgi:hypothetical protein
MDHCNSVVTIPQTLSTCWFNAILMSIFYSQYSRKLLINTDSFTDNKTIISRIFKQILYNRFIDPIKQKKFYKIFKPETILKLMKKKNIITDDLYEYIITNGYNPQFFLPHFLNFIKKTFISLDKIHDKFYPGIKRILNIEKLYDFSDDNEIYMEFDKTPDYICVNIIDHLADFPENYTNLKDIKTRNITINGLDTLDNIITFKGVLYKLDSCVLTNYDDYIDEQPTHVINGITCNNNRYIYNGWMKSTIDPSIQQVHDEDHEDMPCGLISYNWDINDSDENEFCLNREFCTPAKPLKDEYLCFAFNKGNRTLIYTRIEDEYKSQNYNEDGSDEIITIEELKQKLQYTFTETEKLLKQLENIKKSLYSASNTTEANEIRHNIANLQSIIDTNKDLILFYDTKINFITYENYQHEINELEKLSSNIDIKIDELLKENKHLMQLFAQSDKEQKIEIKKNRENNFVEIQKLNENKSNILQQINDNYLVIEDII